MHRCFWQQFFVLIGIFLLQFSGSTAVSVVLCWSLFRRTSATTVAWYWLFLMYGWHLTVCLDKSWYHSCVLCSVLPFWDRISKIFLLFLYYIWEIIIIIITSADLSNCIISIFSSRLRRLWICDRGVMFDFKLCVNVQVTWMVLSRFRLPSFLLQQHVFIS